MNYIKINEKTFPAVIAGKMQDSDWDNRESKAITLEMDYATAMGIFVDGLAWSIVHQPEEGEAQEYDNADFCVAGDVTDHRDGTVTVKMGKLTDLEEAYEMMLGGV